MNRYLNQCALEKDLEELYQSHWSYWLGIARHYGLDEEDTIQEALFSFWKKRDRFVRKSKEETLSLINVDICRAPAGALQISFTSKDWTMTRSWRGQEYKDAQLYSTIIQR